MKEHGVFKLWANQGIVYARIGGAWNQPTALRFAKEFSILVNEQMPSKWAHIVYLDDWALGVPEIEPIVQELVDNCIVQGMLCAAQIFSPSMVKKYQLDKMVVEQVGEFTRKQFTNEEAAATWLENQGLKVNLEQVHSPTKRDDTKAFD